MNSASDPELEPGPPPWSNPPRSHRGLWIVLVFLLALVGVAFLPPVKSKILNLVDRMRSEKVLTKVETVEKVVEKRVEVPVPTPPAPLPTGPSLGTRKDVTGIFSGIRLESNLETSEGRRAMEETTDPGSYAVEVNFKIKIPRAAKTLEEFTGINASLPTLIPSFKDLLSTAKVSGFYHYLYQQKQNAIQANILRLDRVLTRHNFYDLESVLELENPESKQKALLIQSEMDVVSDGSDGDRMESFDDSTFKSQHFQATTSYAWDKVTTKPNPLIPKYEEDLKNVKEQIKAGGLSNTAKAALQDRSREITRLIADLKRRSFLIAQEDPFIVIPKSFRTYRSAHAFAPDIGDYVVVIAGNKAMPAIVGDYGPSDKCGEASLRIAREVDSKASAYNRPVTELRVSYLIFPNSAAKETSAPDYALWRKQCGELLTKLGGDASALVEWKDRLKKEPPPAETPVVAPSSTAPAPPQ
ncbi:MAG TPA: glycoside hydrolase family 75 protein [Verrucomicrobiales bacterium]|nr:glycoside hydrolase family 75 protein [Verrucomicrobiales bacterium]